MVITYLFGAGASCNALPIVNQIPQRLDLMVDRLTSNEFEFNSEESHENISKVDLLQDLLKDLRWLRDSCENHASVDTFAKKLYLKSNHDELSRLKFALSIFLVFEQIINQADKRYDAFFASILNDDYERLPNNIKVISWNYDSQFEKSYSEYTDIDELQRNRAMLRISTKKSSSRPRTPGFNIVKLNGSHNIIDHSGHKSYDFCPTGDVFNRKAMDAILKNYATSKVKKNLFSSGLSFAWEKEDNIIDFAKEISFDTNILVVIGYSFPYFNRDVDRAIIKNMQNLQKVYFQSPEALALKERFSTIRNDIKDLVSISDVNQFYLPDEL